MYALRISEDEPCFVVLFSQENEGWRIMEIFSLTWETLHAFKRRYKSRISWQYDSFRVSTLGHTSNIPFLFQDNGYYFVGDTNLIYLDTEEIAPIVSSFSNKPQ